MIEGWDDFFLLIGSGAAALIGLLFVVATLTSGIEAARASRGDRVYMTPTVFHFSMILAASALGLMPHVERAAECLLFAAAGLAGLLYAILVAWRIREPSPAEPPHWSDFWCYGVAPAVAYVVLISGSAALWSGSASGPHVIGISLVALMLIAIRNAWDLVTYIAVTVHQPS